VITYIRFRWDLYQIERQERKLDRRHKQIIRAAKKRGGTSEELYGLERDRAIGGWHFQDEIRKLHSRYLCSQASRMLLPQPDQKDEMMWEKETPDRICLTERGINHMRALVRAERKAQTELLLMWVPGVVGTLGALIGLAAILTGRK
jgi:5-formyltetrahydrofolate cyclo-ligase